MKEALVILAVLAVLLALTAVRYRKQIATVIGLARMLRDAKRSVQGLRPDLTADTSNSVQLVNCSKCGVWVPRSKARKVGELFYCSDACVTGRRSANKAA